MLKIQLCPESELEEKYWYLPDLSLFAISMAIFWLGAGFMLDTMRDENLRLKTTADNWTKQIQEAEPTVAKFADLDAEMILLNRKMSVLSKITVSKVDKVLPVVVLEQLQTLKPSGIWFHELSFDANKLIRITGASRDSLMISEFLLGLRETMNPETWSNDVRSQIGYVKIAVKDIKHSNSDPVFADQTNVLLFDVSAEVKEKVKSSVMSVSYGPLPRSSSGFRF